MKGNNWWGTDNIKRKQAFHFASFFLFCSFYVESPRCVSVQTDLVWQTFFHFLLPTASGESWGGRGWRKKDTQTFYIHRNSLMCCRCNGSLFIFSPLSVNDPYIVSTLPGGLLVFEGELYFRSLKSHPFYLPIHSHLLVAHSARYFQPSLLSSFWSPLTPSSFPFVLSSPADSPFPPLLNHPVPTVFCSFSVVHHTLITSKNEMWRPLVCSCCLNLPIIEPKGIWNWVWRLHQGHLLHPTG